MPKDSIEEIKKIETEANKEIEHARKESDEEIKNTESKALSQRKQVLAKATQHVEALKRKTRNATKKKVGQIHAENTKIIKRIEQDATPNIDEAVNYIIKKISEGD